MAVAGVLLGALVASGCAAMPDSGGITKVELSQGSADKNLQARVFPVAPGKGAEPRELLTGFLDAVTADEGFDTARKYLTERAAASWNPEAEIRVLSATQIPTDQVVTDADGVYSETVSGQLVATVDEKHSYSLVAGGQNVNSFDFTFVREKGEWRIDKLPPGVIMNEANFRNSFRQVERFFYTAPDPSAPASGNGGQDVLVADPIYLRRRVDPLTAAAKALVAGPSTWLAPVARTAFPSGSTVDKVTLDDSRVAHVQLGGPDLGDPTACRRMATQLFYTFADQGKGQVDRLELKGQRGSCTASRSDGSAVGPGALAGPVPPQQYYQRADNGVLMEADEGHSGDPVPGVLGKPRANGAPQLGTVAVSRDGSQAAALTDDGHQLYTVPLSANTVAMPEPVLSSPVKAGAKDDGLTSPTWDGRGDLWVVDRNPQAPRVVMVRGNKTYTVAVDSLPGETVQALKISSDGARIALVVKSPGVAGSSLRFGRVERGGTPEAPTVRITGVRRAAPSLTDVASVSWAETDQLLVLGKEADRPQQLYYISTDGSQTTDSQLQTGNGLPSSPQSISAAESRGYLLAQPWPVLAVAGGTVYRLVNNQWREAQLVDKARSYFYAG
ncbi:MULTISPECIES: LpqB family beta-propeller domain-containing protein [Kitasatospora]|uniref:LpqB family beta-propeller domain-containing protein n=1 Tax=Kitasatospora cathayae TaxID=3004092 RepID=A0ABY7Q7D5_9ACTN|nr:LpqB family beta-propeller domain-containing protein [Kitasatospora sp. HUAS 3-15]WBP88600.1 LpqB family beta-propeller domain-containing protein [Kitasatospora sp. HUAS 3-15]